MDQRKLRQPLLMGTLLNPATGATGYAALGHFLRNSRRKNDGFESECVYLLLLIQEPDDAGILIVPQSTTPGPSTNYANKTEFERYWDYYAKKDYAGPVYPVKIPT